MEKSTENNTKLSLLCQAQTKEQDLCHQETKVSHLQKELEHLQAQDREQLQCIHTQILNQRKDILALQERSRLSGSAELLKDLVTEIRINLNYKFESQSWAAYQTKTTDDLWRKQS